jgi:hypothetical protein
LASLPVTRTAIVRARYASALGGLGLGAVLYLLYGYVLIALASDRLLSRWHGAAGWAPADNLPVFLAVGYLLIVGFMPFCFRFGFPFGTTLFSVSAGVMVLAAMALGRFLESSWSLSGASSIGWPACLAAVAIAAALGVFSVWLSVRFYENRDL